MPEALVTTAWRRALLSRQTTPGLIRHSDLSDAGASPRVVSIVVRPTSVYLPSGTWCAAGAAKCRRGGTLGECYDNAPAESLWFRVKTEARRERSTFASVAESQAELATYVDYYNPQRHYSALGYECAYLF